VTVDPKNPARFETLIDRFSSLLDSSVDEARIIEGGGRLLRELVAHDDWLPALYAVPGSDRYQQYLLHRDQYDRFSVVSFVWNPGQSTPIHDHRVWGLVGVLRGAERVVTYSRDQAGNLFPDSEVRILSAGDVEAISPKIGDIHSVSNAREGDVSVSIHIYGGDIGRIERATYDASGRPKPFVSGYADAPTLSRH